jgi:flagellar FliL protein
MSTPAPPGSETPPTDTAPRKRGGRKLLLLAIPLLLLAGAGGLVAFRPQLIPGLSRHPAATAAAPPAPAVAAKPVFVDLPEMTVTLPNGGNPKQLRIRIALELMRQPGDAPPADLLTPRVYDALLTYLRTVQGDELEGSLALDRLRGDLYRRLSLVLGDGVLRDVLITGLVLA